jgi:hypothetical protein
MCLRKWGLSALIVVAGCNGGGLGTTDDMELSPPDLAEMVELGPPDLLDNGKYSTDYPAPHPDPPQVISGGGRVLSKPVFVPVFFSNDDSQIKAGIKDFASKVGATKYWEAAVGEYGVGAGTSGMPVELAETAMGTLSDAQIQAWLGGKLNGDDPAFPVPGPGTIYILYYPDGVTITLSGGFGGAQTSCVNFGGYHSNIVLDARHGNRPVPYAVIPRCADFAGNGGIDALTGTSSHELVEASTDPFPQTAPAFAQVDDDHLIWEFALGGGETGDMCAQERSSFTKFAELDYVVQRSWSNAAAMAGHDPCVPTIGNPVYFAAVPVLEDTISLGGGMFSTAGVQIPVGESRVVELDLFSDGPLGGPMTVRVVDLAQLQGGASNLKFALDRTTGLNGEKLHVTITTLRQGQFGANAFAVTASRGGVTHNWFGLVGS